MDRRLNRDIDRLFDKDYLDRHKKDQDLDEGLPGKEQLGEIFLQENEKFLENDYIKPLLAKGFKRIKALPQLPGLKVGTKCKAVYSGYSIEFQDFPVHIIMTNGIRGVKQVVWTAEASEFQNLIGLDQGPAGKVYAVLAKM